MIVMKAEKKHLSVGEVCRIISTCRKLNVNEITFNDLYISFGDKTDSKFKIAGPEKLAQETQADLIAGETEVRQRQLDEMLITDPVSYEKLLTQGELKDGSNGHKQT